MKIEVHQSISEIQADSWNRLVDPTGRRRFPFIRHEFLAAAEHSGCASEESGWLPRHLGAYDVKGKLKAALPLYEKSHSWGEFVFDWSWAQAYQRAGLDYYPKLVSAAPFTPAPSPRLLTNGDDPALAEELLSAAIALASEEGLSSLHVLFPQASEVSALKSAGLRLRKDCQFHWHNRGYQSFDDFLANFSSAKRKKARRDRRHVQEAGISHRWLSGADLDAAIWTDVYELISYTFMRRGALPYFSLDFFLEVSERLPDSIRVVLAEKDREAVAAAVFFLGGDSLYGRYWGSNTDINALHFETCYYQGIDYCIEHGLQRFEPGTQGEHKISRGFTPVETWSAHWLARPEFFSAIGRFVEEETRYVNRYIDAVNSHSPYRQQVQDKDLSVPGSKDYGPKTG